MNTISLVKPSIPAQSGTTAERKWYVAYTCVRHEKKVAEQLQLREFEFYLPLYSVRHQWNRRYVQLRLPLFPGYVFMKIAPSDWFRVLNLPGVIHFVGVKGNPSELADSEIESLRTSLSVRRAEPHPYLPIGRRVRVTSGPLKGLEGVIVRTQNKSHMVVSIDSIARSVSFELETMDLSVA
jgi:transcription antitermination factor NusG